ncbi:MAG: hypothetical protein ACYC35_12940 [Pirellulales bacterium]
MRLAQDVCRRRFVPPSVLYEHLLVELNGPSGLATALVAELKASKRGSSASLKLLRGFLLLMDKAETKDKGRGVESLSDEALRAELDDLLGRICPSLADEPCCQNANPAADPCGPTFADAGTDCGQPCAPLVCP